ncbi:MAG: ribose 5-phosphate isomerase B [Candidatus Gastranaerophilales bacterium]
MQNVKIAIGSDHGGFDYKTQIFEYLSNKGYECIDCGTYEKVSCDYPEFAYKVADKILSNQASCGVLVCGTGIGISIAANKIKGIRAALCSDTFSAHASREHNDANILCLGERTIGVNLAFDIIDTWLQASYEGGRHQKRLDMLE